MALNPVAILLPKGKGQKGGRAFPPGFNPRTPNISAPQFRDHLTDIFTSRQANDSRTLLEQLVQHDPDVSSAMHSYLTIAESAVLDFIAYAPDGNVDPVGIDLARQIIDSVTTAYDYTLGYTRKVSLSATSSELRYMALLRGSCDVELVLDKTYVPTELRIIDGATLFWRSSAPGSWQPYQKPVGSNTEIDLNIPTFFTSRFHQSPTQVYSNSPFVAAINAIAARQEVINELYRIMKVVGYPRLDVKVMENVIAENAPPIIRGDAKKLRTFVEQEVAKIAGALANIRSDQAFVHSSATEASIINDKNPGAGMQIQQIIDVLDAQNQAALKVMPAVVGKGANLQTASTEARLFAMSADALNRIVADVFSQALTLAARLTGYQGRIEARFRPVEMRPVLELEPQLTMRGARLREELSLGTITDIEYHMQMFGRPPPPGSPPLSGTNFLAQQQAAVDPSSGKPNDSLGRSMAPEGGKSAKSNQTKSGSTKAALDNYNSMTLEARVRALEFDRDTRP